MLNGVISYLDSKTCDDAITIMSCSASTVLSSLYSCHMAIDGTPSTAWATNGEGAGAWIQLNFGGLYYVVALEFTHRANARGLFKDLSFEFSNGQSEGPFNLEDVASGSRKFDLLISVLSSYVNITAISHYTKENNGFKEIKVYGCIPGY